MEEKYRDVWREFLDEHALSEIGTEKPEVECELPSSSHLRIVALECAVDSGVPPDRILALARDFETYLRGDDVKS